MKKNIVFLFISMASHCLSAQIDGKIVSEIEIYYSEDQTRLEKPLPDSMTVALRNLVSQIDKLDIIDTPTLELKVSAKFYFVWDLQNRREFETGFSHMEDLEQLTEAMPGIVPEVYIGHIYNLYSSGLSAVFELEKALFYNAKAYNIYKKNEEKLEAAKCQVNASLILTNLGRYSEAIQQAESANQILDTIDLSKSTGVIQRFAPENALGFAHLEFGQYYQSMGDFDLAKRQIHLAVRYFEIALTQLTKTPEFEDSPLLLILKLNLANAYVRLEDSVYADSIIDLLKSMDEIVMSGDMAGTVHLTWTKVWYLKGDLDKASNHLTKAFDVFGYKAKNILEHPLLTFKDIQFKNRLVAALSLQGEICRHYYKRTSSKLYLESAVTSYERCLELIEFIRSNFSSRSTQGAVSAKFGHYFHLAARSAYECHLSYGEDELIYLEKTLVFMEQGKDFLLRQALNFNAFKGTDSEELKRFVSKEDKLIKELRKTDQQFQTCQLQDCARLVNIIDSLNLLLEEIRKTAPSQYREERFTKPSLSFKDIRSKLIDDNRSASIEFSCGESEILVHVIAKNTEFCDTVSYPKDWNALLTAYTQGMKDPSYSPGVFKRGAYRLYQVLLEKTLKKLPISVNRLTIIPNQKLSEIVFEALLTKPHNSSDQYKDLHFLLEKYSISYLYSYSTYQLSKREKIKTPNTLGGYIGVGKDTLRELSRACVESAKIFKGKVFNPANTTQFNTEATNFSVLFFAMHGMIDSIDNPLNYYLLFSEKDSLKVGEIYFSDLNARLAIFGACDTGQGYNSRGEGMLSVCRAFATAGVPSLLGTMAKIPDMPHTADILINFSKLAEGDKEQNRRGLPLDEALKEAKLRYLSQREIQENPHLQHPYYWANFIIVGDATSLHD